MLLKIKSKTGVKFIKSDTRQGHPRETHKKYLYEHNMFSPPAQ